MQKRKNACISLNKAVRTILTAFLNSQQHFTMLYPFVRQILQNNLKMFVSPEIQQLGAF